MVLKEDFLSRIRKIFGLNLYEVKVWTALISRGTSTAGELSDISSVPRSRTYDILESLEKKGFVVMKLGKPIKFIALKPKEVVERAKKNLFVEAKRKSNRLDEIKSTDVMKKLSDLYSKGIKYIEPSDVSAAVRGRHNIHNHLNMMLGSANKTAVIVTTEKGLIRKADALRPTLEKLKKKGVKVRIAAPITPDNYKVARDISKFADVRDLKNIKARFSIVDGKEVMTMLMDDNEVHPNYDIGVWSKTNFFAKALEQIFNNAWTTATPLSKVKVRNV